MAKAGIEVNFGKVSAVLKHQGNTLGICPLKGDFYELELFYQKPRPEVNICIQNDVHLWHRRMGHLGESSLRTLMKSDLVSGLPELKGNMKLEFCNACILGKQCREPFSGTRVRATRPLERVHSDVCGPISPAAWDGSRYFVSFIDDCSHFAVVYLLKRKSEVYEKFRVYEAMATATLGLPISKMTVDQGREYKSTEQKRFYESKGIQIEETVAYTPQQNGVSERFNRTVIEKVRSMMEESKVPKFLWGEAVLAAVYLINRSPTSAIAVLKTPVELWTNQKPDVSKIRVFGCKAFAWVPSQLRKKLDPKSKPAVMMGYAPNGYRLWHSESRQLFVARDVKFDENCFPYANQTKVKSPLIVIPYPEPETEHENRSNNSTSVLQAKPNPVEDRSEQEGEENDPAPCVESVITDDESDDPVESEELTTALPSQKDPGKHLEMDTTRRSDRERRLPGKFKDFITGKIFTAAQTPSTDIQLPCGVPESYGDIFDRPDEMNWVQAVNEELKSLAENRTWRLVDRPPGVMPLKTKWIFRVKTNENGVPVRYKARLVAKGFLQKAGKDYTETYAPVAKLATIRTVLAVVVHRQMHIHQLDVKTAFLYGDLKESIYLAIPDGVDASPGLVCKLQKSLYGLKQSPRCWNEKLNETLLKDGFVRSRHDYCLYVKMVEAKIIVVLIYVDDLLVAGDRLDLVLEVKQMLSRRFKMSDCGEVTIFWESKFGMIDQDEF